MSVVRRVYIRHECLGDDDLFVPCTDLATIEDLANESATRLGRLGIRIPSDNLALSTKQSGLLDSNDLIQDILTDGQVVIASTESAHLCVAPHILLQHPCLKEDISLWVPISGLPTIEALRVAAENLLQQSDPSLRIATLQTEEGTTLSTDAVPEEVVTSGQTLVAASAALRNSRATRRDSAIFAANGMPTASSIVFELNQELAPESQAYLESTCRARENGERSSLSSEKDPVMASISNSEGPSTKSSSLKASSLSSALTYLTVSKESASEKLTYFISTRDELLKRLPGGSWAVFGSDRRPQFKNSSPRALSASPTSQTWHSE
ncbi:hypothetical protein CYMTET_7948 [Cymbomonas tetramitiformis]|uniref:Par3/HAL N-terminal domain-containing protein n=1 Tax=Cymbomonas tetramitiformis TaxID=36881 RepID=A0AAE0GUF0_9CHLO|nr:hypothetical protein CYMTET_7948 [Cymbomonas tetramitiformis]